jgi:hypothetical protein
MEDRSKQFFILFGIIVGSVLAFLWCSHQLFSGSADSARYLLSALAQSQAAIVAIVITLTLFIVQYVSQTYYPRVMDLFLKKCAFWVLLLIYGISILYDTIILSIIPPISPTATLNFSFSIPYLNSSFSSEDLITGAIVLMTITFSALFLFVGYAMENIKTKNIIEELGRGIEVNSFVEKISEGYRTDPRGGGPCVMQGDEDQILPLVDITKRAIRTDDLTTAREGVSKLRENCKKILNEKKYGEKRNETLRHFSSHLDDIGKFAAHQEDESTVREVARTLYELADVAIENGLDDKSIRRVPISLQYIGNSSAERRLMDATLGVTKALEGVGLSASEKDLYETVEIAIDSLRWIGIITVEKNMMWETKRIVDALQNIGKELVERTQKRDTKTLCLIENVAFIAYEIVYRCEMGTESGMCLSVATSAIDCLVNIGYKVEKKRLDIAQKIAKLLKDAWYAGVKSGLHIRKKDVGETIFSWHRETRNDEIRPILQNILNEMSD